MKERYILEALQKAVTQATTLDVKYIGRNMTIPVNGKWLEIVYIPNNIENEFWSDSKTYRGLMRLIVHWPIDDSGVYGALDSAKTICEYFMKGMILSDPANNVRVQITDNPNISDVMEQPPELLVPITLRYSYFKA